MKSAPEIREFLLVRLRCALRRPGMCGGELGILNLMEYVTFIDERTDDWMQRRKELQRRKAFNAGGVIGGFEAIFGFCRRGAHDHEVASVYAVIAFELGYLPLEGDDSLDRVLTPDEYDTLLCTTEEIANEDPCVPETVIDRFGPPSIRWGENDNYPCTLLYLCEAGDSQYVHFDFWTEWYKNAEGIQVPGKFGPQPLLRNVRIPAATFPEEFIFTPFGRSLLRNA